MNILLINVDSRWNIAIRKMYTYYSLIGDQVDMLDLQFSGFPHKNKRIIDASKYDKVFVSNIFERNAYNVTIINCKYVEFGGIGSRDPKKQLNYEIEQCKPFYYSHENISYGFITRGCIHNCWFCKVPKYEGKLKEYNCVQNIVRGLPNEKVKFLDNNILAYDNHQEAFKWLIKHNIKCEFNQGLDFRLVNDENLSLISKLNYIGEYIFAFDDPKYEYILQNKLYLIKKYITKAWKIKFYIYYHPSMEINLLIKRVEWCRKNECLPYIMRDQECYNHHTKNFLTDYSAYCNQPSFFKKIDFELFLEKRHKNIFRIQETLNIYKNYKNMTL